MCVKLSRNLVFICIFLSIAGFTNPAFSASNSNKQASSQSSQRAAQVTAAKKAAAKKAAAKKTAAKKAAAKKAAAKKAAAKKAAAKKAAAKKTAAKKTATKKTTAKKTTAKKTTAKKTTAKKNSGSPPSTLKVNPLRDLGIDKGYVCFRVKAYSNIDVSEFSKAACIYIKNSKEVKLAWAPSSKSAIGYHVYFGTSAKITDHFIADVM